jgi:hypothetical protein
MFIAIMWIDPEPILHIAVIAAKKSGSFPNCGRFRPTISPVRMGG